MKSCLGLVLSTVPATATENPILPTPVKCVWHPALKSCGAMPSTVPSAILSVRRDHVLDKTSVFKGCVPTFISHLHLNVVPFKEIATNLNSAQNQVTIVLSINGLLLPKFAVQLKEIVTPPKHVRGMELTVLLTLFSPTLLYVVL